MQSLRMKSQDAKKIPNWNILVTILNLKFWIQYSRMPSDCIQLCLIINMSLNSCRALRVLCPRHQNKV